MNENVIYFTIYGKLVLFRKLKINRNIFLFDLNKKYIQPTSPDAWAT